MLKCQALLLRATVYYRQTTSTRFYMFYMAKNFLCIPWLNISAHFETTAHFDQKFFACFVVEHYDKAGIFGMPSGIGGWLIAKSER